MPAVLMEYVVSTAREAWRSISLDDKISHRHSILCMRATIGLILFVIPGIYLAIKYMFALVILIDEETISATDALKKSSDITLGVKWSLFGFLLLLILINLIGIALLGIGLLVTIPISTFATVYIFRRLSHETAGEVVVKEVDAESDSGDN